MLRPPAARAAHPHTTAHWGSAASNRPNTAAASPAFGPMRSSRWKWRSKVDSDGAHPGGGAQDPRHLRDRAGRVFPLQRRRQFQHLRVGADRQPPRRHQRLKPAGVATDPLIQRLPRDAHLVTKRVSMGSASDLWLDERLLQYRTQGSCPGNLGRGLVIIGDALNQRLETRWPLRPAAPVGDSRG